MIGRIPIVDVSPVVECGDYPAKATVGEVIPVGATVFRDGHDAVACNVVLTGPDGQAGPWTPMRPSGQGLDRWHADVTCPSPGRWQLRIEAWSDPLATWRHNAEIKVAAGIDVDRMLEEGARLLERAAPGVPTARRKRLREVASAMRRSAWTPIERLGMAFAPDVITTLAEHPLRDLVTSSRSYPLFVQRERALFGSWYEFFPRSEGAGLDPPRSGTFATAAARLPAIAEMGFDVVYLPPIHPVGRAYRKGPNNTLVAGPDDPGSPWAIGSAQGGHDAVHPDLGTIEDFDAFVARAGELGLEVALDFALQASPDHPWVAEHPQWFTTLADGTIAYAENPPKKYQDIYPLNFDNDPQGLYAECERVLRHWIEHGVRIFRVDNPHTKPVEFWTWLIDRIRATDPDVIFLAEAFTRPAMMRALGAVGFDQSYTYFTWRNEKWELEQYLVELAEHTADRMRPNFFVNTPDILTEYLQLGGPPAFKVRAVLAAVGSPSWGVYSGYELYEHVAVRPGSEEYLDSEKYQVRPRDWAAAERQGRTLAGYLTLLNQVRLRHPALQQLRNLRLHHVDNGQIIAISKRLGDDVVLAVVNLDPHHVQEGSVHLDMPALGLDWHERCAVRDEVTGAEWDWGQTNFVRLDPFWEPAHLLHVSRRGW